VRAQTIGLVIGFSLAVAEVGVRGEAPRRQTGDAYYSALQFFKSLPHGDIGDALRGVRPVALSAEQRARAFLSLPTHGELIPTPDEVKHLASLQPVLAFHDRLEAVTIKVIDRPRAEAGLYARSILLLSRPAVNVLSVGQLQGIVAHEIAHDFFWDDYYNARKRTDRLALQGIELKCDGIAALTMLALRLDPKGVASGLGALARYNEALAPINTTNYPDSRERVQFICDVLALFEAK
jgi:hypothetical protein